MEFGGGTQNRLKLNKPSNSHFCREGVVVSSVLGVQLVFSTAQGYEGITEAEVRPVLCSQGCMS